MNLKVQLKDARGRLLWDKDGAIIPQEIPGAVPVYLSDIFTDALAQDKDGPVKPRALSAVLEKLNTTGELDDTRKDEVSSWVEKTESLTPLVKARFFDIAKED